MAQFDFLIIFSIVWASVIVFVLNYIMAIKLWIPQIFGIKKFREKKSNRSSYYNFTIQNKKMQMPFSYFL